MIKYLLLAMVTSHQDGCVIQVRYMKLAYIKLIVLKINVYLKQFQNLLLKYIQKRNFIKFYCRIVPNLTSLCLILCE